MTVRTKRTGGITVYAGSPAELAAVADDYAAGLQLMPDGLNVGHLKQTAEQLRAGVRVYDLGPLRFYADAADGTPFCGPFAPAAEE